MYEPVQPPEFEPPQVRMNLQLGFVIEGEAEQTMTAAQLQFFRDALTVRLYRPVTAPKKRRNFFAGPIFRDKFEHLAFGGTKFVQPWLFRAQRLASVLVAD